MDNLFSFTEPIQFFIRYCSTIKVCKTELYRKHRIYLWCSYVLYPY